MSTISALILSRNEQDVIGQAIDSVSWVDEMIVIDSDSHDKTVSIAKQKKVKVIPHPFTTFADQRNFAAKQASGEWLLYLDADEVISSELSAEIRSCVSKNSDCIGFRLPRKNIYFGQEWPHIDYLERLFQKNALISWVGPVHETPKLNGRVGQLKNVIVHITHRDLNSMLKKTIEWSKIEAQLRFEANHPPVTWWRLIRVGITGFLNSYIYQKGYRVGTAGFIESIYQSYSMLITYIRLWEMQKRNK